MSYTRRKVKQTPARCQGNRIRDSWRVEWPPASGFRCRFLPLRGLVGRPEGRFWRFFVSVGVTSDILCPYAIAPRRDALLLHYLSILNHKEAICHLVEHSVRTGVRVEGILTLHYLLAHGLVASKQAGAIRDHAVRIGAYPQAFADVNKRTSRLCANIPLLRHNLEPLGQMLTDSALAAYADAAAERIPAADRDAFAAADCRNRHHGGTNQALAGGAR